MTEQQDGVKKAIEINMAGMDPEWHVSQRRGFVSITMNMSDGLGFVRIYLISPSDALQFSDALRMAAIQAILPGDIKS
jgi:hypothetical protein